MTDGHFLKPDVCPHCGNDEDGTDTRLRDASEAGDRDIVFDVACCGCGYEWTETYTFTEWAPLVKETKNAPLQMHI